MRRYYFITPASTRADVQALTGRELGVFDATTFRRGRPLGGPLPPAVRLYVPRKAPTDLLGNPIGWTIVSDRLYQLLRPVVNPTDYEVVTPHVFIEGTDEPVPGYVILNPLRQERAMVLDPARPRPIVGNVTFDLAKIPNDAHLFRPAEQPLLVCVSQVLVDALSHKGLTGIALIKTRSARRSD